MRDCMDWRKLVDGRIVVKRLQRSGILFNPWGSLLSLDDSGALYDYLGIKQVDSSLAGKEKWMLKNDSTSSPRSYVSSDEFQITQIWWRWYSLLIYYINRKETFKMSILWCPKKTSRAGRYWSGVSSGTSLYCIQNFSAWRILEQVGIILLLTGK